MPPDSFFARIVRVSWPSLVVLVPLACRDPNAVKWAILPGAVVYGSAGPSVSIAQPIVTGQAAVVTVYTFGDGCARQANTQSTVSGSIAVIEPFDWVVVQTPSNFACDQMLNTFPHSVSLVFSQSGPATIRVLGRKVPFDTADTLEYSVSVQ